MEQEVSVLNFFVTEHRIEHANDLSIRDTSGALSDFKAINLSLFAIDRMIQTAQWNRTSNEAANFRSFLRKQSIDAN